MLNDRNKPGWADQRRNNNCNCDCTPAMGANRCQGQATSSGEVTANICPSCILENSSLRTLELVATTFNPPLYIPATNQLQVTGSGILFGREQADYIVTFTPDTNNIGVSIFNPRVNIRYNVSQRSTVRPCS
jgi:hypothetical protein